MTGKAQARLAADAGSRDGKGKRLSTTAVLCGETIRIKPFSEWPTAANQAQRFSDFETWASQCLEGDDYLRVWKRLNPTMAQVYECFESWKTTTGEDMGESQAS